MSNPKPSFETVYAERKEAARVILTAENADRDARTAKLKALRQERDEAADAIKSDEAHAAEAAAAEKRAAKLAARPTPVRLKKPAAQKSSAAKSATRAPTHSTKKAWARIDKTSGD